MSFLIHLIALLHGNASLVGIVAGLIAPLVTAVVQQPRLSKSIRTLIAVCVSVVIGFGSLAIAGGLDRPKDVLTVVLAVIVSSEAAYQKLWSKLGATQAIEAATSPKPALPVLNLEPDFVDTPHL